MALNSFTSGVNTSFSSQLNDNFSSFSINTIYTGSAFNASASNSSQTNTYEMTLTAASLKKASYLRIVASLSGSVDSNSSAAASCGFKIEEKYSGGSYSTLFDKTIEDENLNDSHVWYNTIEYIYTLTANDITNGVVIKFSGTAAAGVGPSTASIGNVQTFVQMLG